jgi:hypothetical protein
MGKVSENLAHHRKKRLERNRASARLSRRRRKHYLEVLEDRVKELSVTMDAGRRQHTKKAVQAIREGRTACLQMAERDLFSFCANANSTGGRHRSRSHCDSRGSLMDGDEDDEPPLEETAMSHTSISHINKSNTGSSGSVSVNPKLDARFVALQSKWNRMSTDLSQVVMEFHKEQLQSLVIPPHYKFMLWLTLQNEPFYRGGRSSSERLSAARIGEKVSLGC